MWNFDVMQPQTPSFQAHIAYFIYTIRPTVGKSLAVTHLGAGYTIPISRPSLHSLSACHVTEVRELFYFAPATAGMQCHNTSFFELVKLLVRVIETNRLHI